MLPVADQGAPDVGPLGSDPDAALLQRLCVALVHKPRLYVTRVPSGLVQLDHPVAPMAGEDAVVRSQEHDAMPKAHGVESSAIFAKRPPRSSAYPHREFLTEDGDSKEPGRTTTRTDEGFERCLQELLRGSCGGLLSCRLSAADV